LIDYSVRDGKMSQQYSHTDNVIPGQVIQRATGQSMKEPYDKNIFGPMGMKDTQFPVDQGIQSPVMHAFTMDRKFYEDCTYWNPFWGSTPGLPTSNIHDLGKSGPILGTGPWSRRRTSKSKSLRPQWAKAGTSPTSILPTDLSSPTAGSC
jgi:CubicO group peptidase (beta-lactamase class C family)